MVDGCSFGEWYIEYRLTHYGSFERARADRYDCCARGRSGIDGNAACVSVCVCLHVFYGVCTVHICVVLTMSACCTMCYQSARPKIGYGSSSSAAAANTSPNDVYSGLDVCMFDV